MSDPLLDDLNTIYKMEGEILSAAKNQGNVPMTRNGLKLLTGLLKRLNDLIDEGSDIFFEERPFLEPQPIREREVALSKTEQERILSQNKKVIVAIEETEDTKRRSEQNELETQKVAKAIIAVLNKEEAIRNSRLKQASLL